ncbi:MAG: phosphoribosylanthranilate isomerase [Calditrichaeota bacterium]|nr:MAG: phosphoribosylanthranilate isomerase [Calditrichota bacterium]
MHGIIQIAGIIDRAEAEMLLAAGVDWLGFPFRLPVHREDISEAGAAEIIADLKPPHAAVLITYLNQAPEIADLCRRLGVRRVQLHGAVPTDEIRRLRRIMPELFILKSLIVTGDNLPHLEAQVTAYAPLVDGFITDTYDPETGASGATGKTHDWRISRRLVELSPRPVMLAGGLRPENVREAIRQVRPAAVDAHTGVEAPSGRKDPHKVRQFVAEARAGFRISGHLPFE